VKKSCIIRVVNKTISRRQSKLIRRLFLSDQRQRFTGSERLEVDDAFRHAFVSTLVQAQSRHLSPSDSYRAAMVLHHAGDAQRAKQILRHSLGEHPKAVWLMCAVIDRQLIQRGVRQRSGTQFRVDPVSKEWKLIEPRLNPGVRSPSLHAAESERLHSEDL